MKHRRFPGLTKEDVAVLDALEPAAAREFERVVQSQARADKRFRERHVLEGDLGPAGLDGASGETVARWHRGAGGGLRRGSPEHRRALEHRR